jgi:hypothetical protein
MTQMKVWQIIMLVRRKSEIKISKVNVGKEVKKEQVCSEKI